MQYIFLHEPDPSGSRVPPSCWRGGALDPEGSSCNAGHPKFVLRSRKTFFFSQVGVVWWEEVVFALSATRLYSLSMGSGTTFPGPSLWFFPSGGRLRGKVWLARALSAPRAPCAGLFSIGSRITFANREIFSLGLLSRYCVNTNVLKCYFGL